MKKNTKPLEQALNADLRGSWPALQRAAQRARELAAQTGTAIVVSRDGKIEHIQPNAFNNRSSVPVITSKHDQIDSN
ncbi:hypothetical protein SAMN05421644_10483 [Allochromatium warmingii]|uniref:Uncharacterized protein n=1 Tax=Allochromatium warmingii TaxID=61595 RepID=A0A1H3C2I5_ALLWA|nr:hypothetical protein [Allochromatium warmingii]SDX47719.1 hypothetical protein SAMN05421644_10483 [Allochromatium warmingii]